MPLNFFFNYKNMPSHHRKQNHAAIGTQFLHFKLGLMTRIKLHRVLDDITT